MSENKKKEPIYKKWWFWLIIVVIIIGIGASSQSNLNSLETSGQVIDSEQTNNILDEIVENTEEPDVPTEYKNALKQAKTYSEYMHMSKKGIYDQLTSDYGGQFEADAAQYAIDNVNADWKDNALEQAKSYQETMSMSKNAIYDQLTSEYGGKFTPEEAQYAIDHLND